MNELLKTCNGCGIEKPHSAFGHVKPGRGDRFNLTSRCKACRAARNLRWHKDNTTQSKANKQAFNVRKKDHVSAYNKTKREANPQLHAKRFQAWLQNNRPYRTSKQRERDALKRGATPPWITPIQRARMQEFYELAAARRVQTGKQFHVDHIVPLDGETFSGLHVPWNLQVISAFDNLSKKNRVPEEYVHLFWSAA